MPKGIMCTMKQQLIYCPTMKWSGQMMSVEKLRGNMGMGSFETVCTHKRPPAVVYGHMLLWNQALSKIMWWSKALHINLKTWMTSSTNTRTNRRQLAKVVILLLTQTGQLMLRVMTLPDQWSMNGQNSKRIWSYLGKLYRTHSYSFLMTVIYLFIFYWVDFLYEELSRNKVGWDNSDNPCSEVASRRPLVIVSG